MPIEAFRGAPGISAQSLARLSPVEGEDSHESPFLVTLKGYRTLFLRPGVWSGESKSLLDSAAAKAILTKTKSRYHADLVYAMEKRLGKPMNAADADLYVPVSVAISNLASACNKLKALPAEERKFSGSNTGFNSLAFVECCLDRMEVAQQEVLPATTPTLENNLHFDIGKVTGNAGLIEQLRRQPKDPKGWEKDQGRISQSDRAIRLFINKKARVTSLAVASYERTRGRPLAPFEVALIQQVSSQIYDVIKAAGFSSTMTDVELGVLVEKILSAGETAATESPRGSAGMQEIAPLMVRLASQEPGISGIASIELDEILERAVQAMLDKKDVTSIDRVSSLYAAILSSPVPDNPEILYQTEGFKASRFFSLVTSEKFEDNPELFFRVFTSGDLPGVMEDILLEDTEGLDLHHQEYAEKLKYNIVLGWLKLANNADDRLIEKIKDYLTKVNPCDAKTLALVEGTEIWKLSTAGSPSIQVEARSTRDNVRELFSLLEIDEKLVYSNDTLNFKEAEDALFVSQNFQQDQLVVADTQTIGRLHGLAAEAAQGSMDPKWKEKGYQIDSLVIDCGDPDQLKALALFCTKYAPFWQRYERYIDVDNICEEEEFMKVADRIHTIPIVTLINPQLLPVLDTDTIPELDGTGAGNVYDAAQLKQRGLSGLPEGLRLLLGKGKVNLAVSKEYLVEHADPDDEHDIFTMMEEAVDDEDVGDLSQLKFDLIGEVGKYLPFKIYGISLKVNRLADFEKIHLALGDVLDAVLE